MRLIYIFIFTIMITNTKAQESIYDILLYDISGDIIDLNDFRGKYILFINVASECGFTSQYSALQELYEKYNKDLMIIASPCNQFGGQEPNNGEEIKTFCEKNFGVTFLITEKIDVKGGNQHSLYRWLTNIEYNTVSSSTVRWNFQKYIVDRDGKLINYFYSITNPLSSKITSIIDNKN